MTEKRMGRNLRARRLAKPWTIEHLAQLSGVSARTISRIESGAVEPKLTTVAALAAAFDVDADTVMNGLSGEAVEELIAAYACTVCGAPLSERGFVANEHGDEEYELFGCGATRGWRSRPCPLDPQFPKFEDYELEWVEDGNTFVCLAGGKTTSARAVELQHGHGPSRETAEQWVRRAYTQARYGYDEAERLYPLHSLIA